MVGEQSTYDSYMESSKDQQKHSESKETFVKVENKRSKG